MRIQFVYGTRNDYVDMYVEKLPTEEECKLIEDYISDVKEAHIADHGSLDGFDYWWVCHDACMKYLKVLANPVMETFYI